MAEPKVGDRISLDAKKVGQPRRGGCRPGRPRRAVRRAPRDRVGRRRASVLAPGAGVLLVEGVPASPKGNGGRSPRRRPRLRQAGEGQEGKRSKSIASDSPGQGPVSAPWDTMALVKRGLAGLAIVLVSAAAAVRAHGAMRRRSSRATTCRTATRAARSGSSATSGGRHLLPHGGPLRRQAVRA